MKLNQALKQKKRLAGDIQTIKDLLETQNVKPKEQPFDYDVAELLTDLDKKMAQIIAVKAAIAVANQAIHEKIFKLAELKGIVTMLKALDTRNGVFKEGGGGYGADAYDVEYVAQLGKTDVDQRVKDLETEINDLQDQLDEFNATQTVKIAG